MSDANKPNQNLKEINENAGPVRFAIPWTGSDTAQFPMWSSHIYVGTTGDFKVRLKGNRTYLTDSTASAHDAEFTGALAGTMYPIQADRLYGSSSAGGILITWGEPTR